MRDNPKIDPPSLGLNVPTVLGIERASSNVAPQFNLGSGWTTPGINANTYRRQINNNYQWAGSVTKIIGKHVIKSGAQLRFNQFNVYNPGSDFAGAYTFTGQITSSTRTANAVNTIADFLLGAVKSSVYAIPQPPTGRRNHNLGLFVQDDWKITSKLTLNLGLRYEYESPMTIANNMYSRLDPVSAKLLVAGKNASNTLNLEGDKLNFAPRVGFAYSVTKNTVVRSAFGMFYSQIFSNLGGIVPYPGFTVTQRFQDPGVGIAQPFRLSQGMPLTAVQSSTIRSL